MQPLLTTRYPYWRRSLSVAADALIACWPLWEPSGSVAFDISGNNRHGAYTGVDLNYPGIGDGSPCPYFDGTSDRCNIYSSSLASAFNNAEGTVAIWMKVNSASVWTDAAFRTIYILRTDANNAVQLVKSSASNTFQFFYVAGGTSKSVSKASYSPTAWQHIALTWSKSADALKAYVNGIQEGATQTGLGTWSGALASTACNIGCRLSTPDQIWNGNLAYGKLWSRVLSVGELAEEYRI